MIRSTRIFIAISVLVLASLACQALTGGGSSAPEAFPPADDSQPVATIESQSPEQPQQEQEEPLEEEEAAPEAAAAGLGFETEFPVPDDASNGFDFGDGMISFQTGLSIEESLAFYRDAFAAEGYTEREILTSVTETVFSIVFDGHESGKAIVIQAVDLGTSVNITIRFEDV